MREPGNRIQQIDPKIGPVLATMPAPGGGADSGLTWAEGTLWLGRYRDREICSDRSAGGAVLRTIESNLFVTPGHVDRRSAVARHLEWSSRNWHGDYGLLKTQVERA